MYPMGPSMILTSLFGVFTLAKTASGTTHDIIQRDVCIIGGGSAGTYTAVRLQQMGLSVALIEKENRLGGQVNTYVDSATGRTIDYGVKVFNNDSVVTNYFASLNVELAPFTGYAANQTTIYADLATGSDVSASEIHVPSTAEITDGLSRYQALLNKYPYLGSGFQLPSPVPEELLITWGDFLKEHGLQAISGLVYGLVGGPGNILAQPTIYVAKNFNTVQVQSALHGSSLTQADGNNQALYDSALDRLGNGTNAFVSSTVTEVTRGHEGVQVDVMTPEGRKTIHARRLVLAVPPKLPILEPFLDLSPRERDRFGQFNNSYLYASIVANSGIPMSVSLANVDLSAPFGIPSEPGIFLTEPTGVNEDHIVLYGNPFFMSEHEVRADIVASLARWKKASNQSTGSSEEPRIVAFSNHSPYFLTVSVDAIKNGFYNELNSLQGERNTYFTGAAWQTSDSTAIWSFTETQILPVIVASLG